MRAEFINPFVEAGVNVLEAVMGSPPEAGQLAVRSATFASHQVLIVIGVTGAAEGQAVYGMSLVTATKLAAAMSNLPTMAFDESAMGAVVELGSMIGGQAAALLSERGYGIAIAPPALVRGSQVELCTAIPALVVPLYTDFGQIEISVALQEPAPSGAAPGPAREDGRVS